MTVRLPHPLRGLSFLALVALLAGLLTVVNNPSGGAATLPGGFVEEVVASTEISSITAFDFLPDGRIVVTEKRGRIKVISATDPTDATTVLNIQTIVNTAADRGLIGLAVDPDFATTERVFISYSYDPPEVLDPAPYWDGNTTTTRTLGNGSENGSGQRVSRISSWQLDSATNYTSVVAGSEVILMGANSTWDNIGDPFAYQTNYDVEWACMTYVGGELPQDGTPIDDCLPSEGVSHAIDGLAFGPDGYLYASMGDGAAWNDVDKKALRALDPDILAGKIIRIDPVTGDAVPSNPFYSGDGTDNASHVWAMGLRNPFRFTFDSGTGDMYIGDVGWSTYEELNLGVAGASYGWPCFEGGLTPAQIAADITEGPGSNIAQSSYSSLAECAAYPAVGQTPPTRAWCHYHVNPGVCQPENTSLSSLAGVVYPGGSYPAAYEGLWYGDIVAGWMKVLDLSTGETLEITDDFSVPVAMRLGPDGDVYYASRGNDEIIAIRFDGGDNQQPTALVAADQTNGLAPLSVAFDGTGSTDADGAILTYEWDFGDGAADVGATVSHDYTVDGTYTAELTVTDNSGGTDTDDIVITVGNNAPVPTIEFPADGAVLDIGAVVQFEGSATDAQDGQIGDLQLAWTGIFHHNDHIHEDVYEGQGSLPVPLNFEDHADDTYIEICLTATDLGGLEGTTCIDIFPTEVDYTFETSPAGLDVVYNGQQLGTPVTMVVPSGVTRSIDVPVPQGGLGFSEWSLGGPKNQMIVTEFTDQTVTATFEVGNDGPNLHFGLVEDVTDTWQTVDLPDTYVAPVVVATPRYAPTDTGGVVRVRNVGPTSFEMRFQDPAGSSATADVEFVVAESGVYNLLDHGIVLEAGTVVSTITDHAASWVGERLTPATTFTTPVVVGQVMTENDADWSVFWARGGNKGLPPKSDDIFVGKHVGSDPDIVRADETLGYIIVEAGQWPVGPLTFSAGVTDRVVLGAGNAAPHAEDLGGLWASHGVGSQGGMWSNDGDWAVLTESFTEIGASLDLMVDEDTLGDGERNDSGQRVGYLVLDEGAPPQLAPSSTSVTEPDSGSIVVDVPFTLSHATDVDVTAEVAIAPFVDDWAATVGVDVSLVSGSLLIPAGEQGGTIQLEIFGDQLPEQPAPALLFEGFEWVLLQLTQITNATLDVDSTFFGFAPVTIRDND